MSNSDGRNLAECRQAMVLKPGGKMVLPVGTGDGQRLIVVEQGDDRKVRTRELIAVRFSPLITSH